MVLGDITNALSELIVSFPVEVSDNILGLILILKTLGIAAIVYVIYVIIMGVFTYRRMKDVKNIKKQADAIGKKVNSIDKKIDKLLKKK
jgi:uncharacterized protein YoxC